MPINQERSTRKPSGGRIRDHRKSKQFSQGSQPIMTKLAPTVTSAVRIIGGHTKTKLRSADIINVVDPATKTAKKAKIETVVDNPANRNFVRRNILTKGSIVQTDLGKVRITSRPGQDNVLNGVLTN